MVGFDGSGRDLEKSGDFTFGREARWISGNGQSGGDVRIHSGDSSIGTGPEVPRGKMELSGEAALEGRDQT